MMSKKHILKIMNNIYTYYIRCSFTFAHIQLPKKIYYFKMECDVVTVFCFNDYNKIYILSSMRTQNIRNVLKEYCVFGSTLFSYISLV